ncbi:MAG: hypothetical protein Q8T08_07770, partial [Ignavibacteria bacterium]|nr:hypothetical protein [Ignavibacteria bacterium]
KYIIHNIYFTDIEARWANGFFCKKILQQNFESFDQQRIKIKCIPCANRMDHFFYNAKIKKRS